MLGYRTSPGVAFQHVISMGDSISALNSPTWPAQLGTLLGPSWPVTNGAVSGHTLSQMLSRFGSLYDEFPYRRGTLLGGINDINFLAATGEDVIELWAEVADAMRAAGVSVIGVSLLPYKNSPFWTAGNQTDLEVANEGIADYCATHDLVFVNAYPDFDDPEDPDALKSEYDSGDGLHLSQAGSNRLAQLVFEAWR